MSISNSISKMRSGVIGSAAYFGPIRAMSKILKSDDQTDNVFGRAFTLNADDTAAAGGARTFIGILSNPHAYAVDSTYIENGQSGEFIHMGEVFVKLEPAVVSGATAAVPAVGDAVYYTSAGVLTADATDKDTVAVAHNKIQGAMITRHAPVVDTDGNYIAVVSLTGLQKPIA